MKKDYKEWHFLILALQVVFVLLGVLNAAYQFVTHVATPGLTAALDSATCIVTVAAYISLAVYAVWGYKHSIVPYRIAITMYYTMLIAQGLRVLLAGEYNDAKVLLLVLIAIKLPLLIAYDNTFKKHKKAALILGAIILALSLFGAVSHVAGIENIDAANAAAELPFAEFWIASALYTVYLSRCHWSASGKQTVDFFSIEEDE